MSELVDKLIEMRACEDAVEWIGERTLEEAWTECERGDWMLWLAARHVGRPGWSSHQEVVLVACWCARRAATQISPSDDRHLRAMEIAEAWCHGSATARSVRHAAEAAWDAARVADGAAARYGWRALWAAAYAAAYAAAWDAAACAAAYAAYAAAWAADAACAAAWEAARSTRESELRAIADRCRDVLRIGEM